MNIEEILRDIETKMLTKGNLTRWVSDKKWISKRNLDYLVTEIENLFEVDGVSLVSKINCILANKSNLCACSAKLSNKSDFHRFICKKCRNETKNRIRIDTTMERYGVSHVKRLKSVDEKYRATCLDRYGADHSFKNESVRKKKEKTMIERHGASNSFSSDSIREKIAETNLSRYGAENIFASDHAKQKRKETFLVNYGVDHPMKNETHIKKVIDNKNKNYFLSLSDEARTAISNIKEIYEEDHVEGNNTISFISKKYQIPINYFRSLLNDLDLPVIRRFYTSQGEQILFDFISSFYDGTILRNDRKVLGNQYELDLYLPELSLAIEYHGTYWHSNLENPDKHLDKWKLCEQKGIKLIQIFDWELEEKEEIVKSILRSAIGNNNRTKIHGRKCSVKILQAKEYAEFLEAHHLQGNCAAAIKLGLFHNDDLMAVMSFSKPRNSKRYTHEMIRFASHKDYIVLGAASKLFSYFKKNYIFESIVSYSDKRFFSGKTYEHLGFTLSHESSPNYWYSSDEGRITRYNAQKHKLKAILGENFDPTRTERDNMLSNNYRIVHDAGNRVFIFYK